MVSALIALLTIIVYPWQRLLSLPTSISLIGLCLSHLTYDHAHIVGRKGESILLSMCILIISDNLVHLFILRLYCQVLTSRRVS